MAEQQPQQGLSGTDGAAEPALERQDSPPPQQDAVDSSAGQATSLATIAEEGGIKRITRGRGRLIDHQPWVLTQEGGQEGGAGHGGRARPRSLELSQPGDYGTFSVRGRGKGRDIVTVLPPSHSSKVVFSAGLEKQQELQARQRGTLATLAGTKQPSQSVAEVINKLEGTEPATEKRGRGRPKGSKNKGKFLSFLGLVPIKSPIKKRFTRYGQNACK